MKKTTSMYKWIINSNNNALHSCNRYSSSKYNRHLSSNSSIYNNRSLNPMDSNSNYLNILCILYLVLDWISSNIQSIAKESSCRMGIIVMYLITFQVVRKARRNLKLLGRTVAVVELVRWVQGEDRECNCRVLEVALVNSNIQVEESKASRCCRRMILLQLGSSSEVTLIGRMNLMGLIVIITNPAVIGMQLPVRLGRAV